MQLLDKVVNSAEVGTDRAALETRHLAEVFEVGQQLVFRGFHALFLYRETETV